MKLTLSLSNNNRNSKILYFSAFFVGIILLTGSIFPVMSFVEAQRPYKVIERFDQQDVPPGLTRVTIVHGVDEQRTEIDHGPGKVPPPFQKQESFQCGSGDYTDLCDTNTWTGRYWPNLPVEYRVNLANSGDDGNYLAAVNAGIQAWEDDTNSSFDATFLGTTNKKTTTAEPRARMDGNNVIGWGSTNHFGNNIIAVVVYFYYTATLQMVEADMRFNQDFPWASNGGPGEIDDPDTTPGLAGFFDVQGIATHEGGHFVAGLTDIYHETERELTMYGYGSTGELYARTLGYGDQLSIASAYPGSSPPPLANDPPTVEITGPADSSTFNEGTSISFSGTASDSEDGVLTSSLLWSSNLDGTIGSKGSFSATLTPGTHTITASVSDTGGKTGSSSIKVTVNSSSPSPPGGSTISVDSIILTTEGGKNQDKHLKIALHVSDDVVGATVSIELDNTTTGQTWIGTATTDSSGNILFTLKNFPDGCYTTTVTSVTASGLTGDTSTPANGICKPT